MTNLNQFKQVGIQISKQNPNWVVHEGPVVIRGYGNTYKTRLAIMLAIETMMTIRKSTDVPQSLTITSWACSNEEFFKFVAGCVPDGAWVKDTVRDTIDAFCAHFNFKLRSYSVITPGQRYDLAFDADVLNHVILDELECLDSSPLSRRDPCYGVKRICELVTGAVFVIAPMVTRRHSMEIENNLNKKLIPVMEMADIVLETSVSEFQLVNLYNVTGLPLQVDWEFADPDDRIEVDVEHITFGERRSGDHMGPIDID